MLKKLGMQAQAAGPHKSLGVGIVFHHLSLQPCSMPIFLIGQKTKQPPLVCFGQKDSKMARSNLTP